MKLNIKIVQQVMKRMNGLRDDIIYRPPIQEPASKLPEPKNMESSN